MPGSRTGETDCQHQHHRHCRHRHIVSSAAATRRHRRPRQIAPPPTDWFLRGHPSTIPTHLRTRCHQLSLLLLSIIRSVFRTPRPPLPPSCPPPPPPLAAASLWPFCLPLPPPDRSVRVVLVLSNPRSPPILDALPALIPHIQNPEPAKYHKNKHTLVSIFARQVLEQTPFPILSSSIQQLHFWRSAWQASICNAVWAAILLRCLHSSLWMSFCVSIRAHY